MALKFLNFVADTLASTVEVGTTEFSIGAVQAARIEAVLGVGDQFPLVLWTGGESAPEIVYVTAVVGSALTVLRAQEGTTAQGWSVGTRVVGSVTAAMMVAATDAVISVNGHTGVVVLDGDDLGLGNVDNTSDAAKPISDAVQVALDALATSIAQTVLDVVTPSLDDFQTALDLKANIADPTFTGTVTMEDLVVTGDASVTGSLTVNSSLVNQAGFVQAWPIDTGLPDGYLECNGSTVSRTTYAALFAAIGTTWGAGDGSSTFRLPPFRGRFLRGFDNGAGIDSGRTFASHQASATARHKHWLFNIDDTDSSVSAATQVAEEKSEGAESDYRLGGSATDATLGLSSYHLNDDLDDEVTVDETRPNNETVIFIIKT